jgi:hypothetical protein
VRMVFPAEDDHVGIPEDEVDHAAGESLTSTCSP